MKKIFSAFVIAVCCMFMAMPAQAQQLKWRVKRGVKMTKIGMADIRETRIILPVSLLVRWLSSPFPL